MSTYSEEYRMLNAAQKEAVDTLEGPLLVIAGPGTGKTQLLSARVARILEKTDTLPENILCLTFTESGASNMRERLTRFVGQAAYDVQIGTYHAFGGDLIQRYPQYFMESRLQSPIDELGRHQILKDIVAKMSYSNPLKQTQHHLGDLLSTVSEIKRALLTPDELRAIAKENNTFLTAASRYASEILAPVTTVSSYKAVFPHFAALLPALKTLLPNRVANARFGCIAQLAINELAEAIIQAEGSKKTKALTEWKNNWLAKDQHNHFVFDGELQNERIIALAQVCEQYTSALEAKGLYDFDDMILRSITALESHQDFKFSLQERHQYILLDEFQDTNAAQARLVTLLTDNPVNEGRPNVMAVGDDDQAIYAFQGAQYSNMLDFYQQYRDVKVVNLTENYRSHSDILQTAHQIAGQIQERLHHRFDGMSKDLRAAGNIDSSEIRRTEFLSDIAQYSWIAEQVKELIGMGVHPSEIAVLAPRHKYLEPMVGYLNALDIPVRYEKRENILETSVIQQIITIAQLLEALSKNNDGVANALWPQVLSFEFWQLPISQVWQLSWQVNDGRINWSQAVLSNEVTREVALLLFAIASRVNTETCESLLDMIIGTQPVTTNEEDLPEVSSPLRSYYTSEHVQATQPDLFYETLSHLTVLRDKLRDHQVAHQHILRLHDLIELVELYESAGERMLDTSPYNQATEAVQLMTVYKSKGLEFEHVFLVNCHDDVWGSSSRSSANRITLPANLQPIRKSGTTQDERLRLLFVAITRAKIGLYLTSFTSTFAGKLTKHLKYLDEQDQADGTRRCLVLPENNQLVIKDNKDRPVVESLTLHWQNRHINILKDTQLENLLTERLARYQLSPTHLNQFTDVIYGGPQQFFMNTILRFPQAPTVSSQYGSAIHDTLEWIQRKVNTTHTLPSQPHILEYFKKAMQKSSLTEEQIDLEIERGHHALEAYVTARHSMFKQGNEPEYVFKHEGVFIGEAHLGGKIDLIELDPEHKTICVVDYKTGSWFNKWKSDVKLHKYRQQLYAYKLLIEGSHHFRGYTVSAGRIEFVEPDGQGNIYSLDLTFDTEELDRTRQLIQAMWKHVKAVDLPDISGYSKDLKGIQAFEDDLLKS